MIYSAISSDTGTPDKDDRSLERPPLNLKKEDLLQQWNHTQAEYPQDRCIHHLIEYQVDRTPDRVAIADADSTLTYRELNDRANQVAHYLQNLGVAPDTLVGIYMKRSPDMVVALLGILKSGAGYVPLDPAFPKERLEFMLEDAQISIILTESSQLADLPAHQAQVISIDHDWQAIAQYSQENPHSAVTSENLAYTIYTSGSTGKPKGVQIGHRSVVNFLVSMRREPGLTQEDILLAVTTISFDIAVLELYLPLMVGARIFLVSREVAIDPIRLIEALERSSATVMQATPATWQMLLAADWQGNSHLKILCGGEAMPRSLADRLLARSASVWNMYGPTETTVWSAVYRVEPGENPVLAGRPIANTQFYIVDPNLRRKSDSLQLLPIGEAGELLIGGDGLARGYLNREDLTIEKFIYGSLSEQHQVRLYRTGDLARLLPDGNVELIGRIDNQVKIRGFRIELGDIEAALSQHPSIREVAVVAREDATGEKCLIAYLVADLYTARVPFQCQCQIESEGFVPVQATTVDLSKNGLCLTDVPTDWQVGQNIRICLQLRGVEQELILEGILAWRQKQFTGVFFQFTPAQQAILRQSIQHITNVDGVAVSDRHRRYLRVTFQKTCSVELESGRVLEVNTQDISLGGIGLIARQGDVWQTGQGIRLQLQLPGVGDSLFLKGVVVWHRGRKAGIILETTSTQQAQLHQGINHIITAQGLYLVDLRSFIKKKLPEYMTPSMFVIMDNLPLTPNGKIDRRALPEPSQGRAFLEEQFVAPRNPIEEKLAHIWGSVLNVPQVGIEDNFFELGGHSLLTPRLLLQVRDAFGVELSLATLFESPTIAELAKAIAIAQDSHSVAQSDSVTIAELQADAVLDASIRPAVPFTEFCAEPQQIFLTGVTGYLGAFLLHELLEQTQAKIYCLVRAANLEVAKQKIAANLKNYALPDEKLGDRVVPVLGNLAHPQFGLFKQQFDDLAAKIDWIYHCGASVNLIFPYAPLRAANVLGTQEILRLASLVKVKPVHFISTLDVFQSPQYMEMQTILETDELSTPAGLCDGYAQSKWVGEKLVLEAHARGIPACIYRPGMISGHTQTGASQTNDTVCRLIKGLIQMGIAPDMQIALSLTPVDYVSQAIVHLSRQPESFGKTFHLASPQALPWQELVKEIKNFGYSIEVTNYKQWQAQLFEVANSKTDNALSPLLFLFTDWKNQSEHSYLETTALVSRPFDCHNTLSGLSGTSITCPNLDTQVFYAYFSYMIRSGFLMAPSKVD